MAREDRESRDRPLYMIGVAAELAGVHPQTLRIYERKRLVTPKRSAGNTRLYSQRDIERLQLIQHLTQNGVNLAGVERILDLEQELQALQTQMERLQDHLEEARQRAEKQRDAIRREYKAEIVMVRRGTLARREAG